MTHPHAYAANGMAGTARARMRAFTPCAMAVAPWSTLPISIVADQKHGRPRRPEVST
jgi:hypothetical protein